ncbi:MAG: hypothetical protein ACRDD8_05290 [Bacteroidales bacterium]
MSCSYFQTFGITEQWDKIEAIREFSEGNSLRHYVRRWNDEKNVMTKNVDWRKRHVCVNYLEYVVNSYLSFLEPMKNIQGYKGKYTKVKKRRLQDFFYANRWDDFFKKVARYRKYYGDVYIYWYLDSKDMIRLKILDSKDVRIMIDSNEEPFAYTYTKNITSQKRKGTTDEFEDISVETKWVFTEGRVDIYEEGQLKETVMNKLEYSKLIPIIHINHCMQDNSPYSHMPAEDLIDCVLLLEKLDTEITHVNTMAGQPQILAIDADFDSENSIVGPNGIMYFDTKKADNPLEKVTQAKITKQEITNGLETFYKQKRETMDLLYSKAKLIPPSLAEKVVGSDSSKVAQMFKQDMEYEIYDFYTEFSVKTAAILNILMTGSPEGDIHFIVPDVSITQTETEKYILKGYKMQTAELTMKENLRLEGFTEDEIEERIEQWREEEIMKQEIAGHNQTIQADKQIEHAEKMQKENAKVQIKVSENKAKEAEAKGGLQTQIKSAEQTSKKIPTSNNTK